MTARDHLRGALVAFALFFMLVLPWGLPGASELKSLQRPFRIAQSWGLYGVGPANAWVFEVWFEDEVVYRAGDMDHTWLRSVFRYRRVRPVVVNTCRNKSKNAHGLANVVVRRALEENPNLTEISIRCTRSPWPGTEPQEVHRLTMHAPNWYPY